ncbi:MAG: flagellin [Pseudomonadota bacterium]
MAISLVTNVETVTVLKNMEKTQRTLASNIGRLSSGLRINRAGDDAAGLAISEGLKAQIRSLAQAQRNCQDGVSMIQVAEGALNEIHGVLGRLRELAVQSANGTQDATTRGYLNSEFTSLKSEIDRIAKVTDYNGTLLINSNYSFRFWVGASANSSTNSITVSVAAATLTALGSAVAPGVSTLDLCSIGAFTDAVRAISMIDAAIKDISSARAKIGAGQNRLTITIDNLASQRESTMAANSRIRDVDVSSETSDFTRNQILMQAGVSVLAQANQLPSVGLSLLR